MTIHALLISLSIPTALNAALNNDVQGERLQDVANLVGVHYEGVSMILRLLGAKVGKRIYWPGSGIEGLVEYDLLEVGDDVVFGSRSMIMCADRDEALQVSFRLAVSRRTAIW
mmetsp:Transcript_37294/g.99351  ORF Transcript_37294/g.99351 Transcript_37294/m.99351 type:complete len:113 (-) Transcript_37294:421-759(-)